jgi:hypothetical protein
MNNSYSSNSYPPQFNNPNSGFTGTQYLGSNPDNNGQHFFSSFNNAGQGVLHDLNGDIIPMNGDGTITLNNNGRQVTYQKKNNGMWGSSNGSNTSFFGLGGRKRKLTKGGKKSKKGGKKSKKSRRRRTSRM